MAVTLSFSDGPPLVSLLCLPSLSLPVPSPPLHGQVHFFSHSCPQSLGLLVFQTPVPQAHAFSLITAHIYVLLCSIPIMALVACHVKRVFLYHAGPCLSFWLLPTIQQYRQCLSIRWSPHCPLTPPTFICFLFLALRMVVPAPHIPSPQPFPSADPTCSSRPRSGPI